jgi:hypothetical protein
VDAATFGEECCHFYYEDTVATGTSIFNAYLLILLEF